MQIQNSYTPLNFEGKVKFKRASLFSRVKLCSFEVPHKELGTVKISTEKTKKGRYIIRTGTKNINTITRENFCMSTDEIYGVDIKTNEYYRGQHLGELTRLASIITMLKNGLKEINLYSVDKAVQFHSKYKFEPNITEPHSAIIILKNIQSARIKSFEIKTKEIIEKYKKTENKEELLKATNELVTSFIKKVNPSQDTSNTRYKFWGLDMRLTRENVLKHKNFFNALFAKHNIDYQI
jgi:hypothetical protein